MMSRKPKSGLDAIVQQMDKLFGRGTVMRLGDQTAIDVPAVPTGSMGLDRVLGVGGLPRGRMVEMFGQESSGKTTLALSVIARAQQAGGVAAFVDAEHALDPRYAANLGVKVDDLLISQPDFGEQALEIIDALVRSGAVDVIVLDSVAALVPKAELEGAVGDAHVGLHARLMSQALRKLAPIAARNGTLVIFINQVRQKIGVSFGSNETTTGGNALKFYASVRLKVQRIGQLKEGDQVKGNRVRVRVVKNKVAPPFGTAEFDLIFNRGIDNTAELLDMALDKGVVVKNGAWYSFMDSQLGHGRGQVIEAMKQDPDLALRIETALMEEHAQAAVG
jgi:recombination protein RecA